MIDPRMQEILRLASVRRLPAGAPSIDGELARIARGLKREARRAEPCAGAWGALVPVELAERCRLDGLRAGVLTVRVDSSSTHWSLDRLLREGGLDRLRAATGGEVQRVKLRLGLGSRDAGPSA